LSCLELLRNSSTEDRFTLPNHIILDTRLVTISFPFLQAIGDVAIQNIGFSLFNFKYEDNELPEFIGGNP